MSDAMRMYVEVGFNVLYLIVVWAMNGIMSVQMKGVPQEDRKIANLFRWAFVLLAIGDTGHAGFRVAAYAMGGLEQNSALVGLGALATAVTVTFFYVVMLYIWKERFRGNFGLLEYALLATVPMRLIVMAFPQNDWGASVPPAFWGLFRNLFLVILGVGVLYLYLRDSVKTKDRLFRWMGYCVLFSCVIFLPILYTRHSVRTRYTHHRDVDDPQNGHVCGDSVPGLLWVVAAANSLSCVRFSRLMKTKSPAKSGDFV